MLVEASEDPRVCKQFSADKVKDLKFSDILKQESENDLKVRIATFCLNFIKHNH
jgi:hypothetical protein